MRASCACLLSVCLLCAHNQDILFDYVNLCANCHALKKSVTPAQFDEQAIEYQNPKTLKRLCEIRSWLFEIKQEEGKCLERLEKLRVAKRAAILESLAKACLKFAHSKQEREKCVRRLDGATKERLLNAVTPD